MFVPSSRPSPDVVLRWAESLEALLTNQCKTNKTSCLSLSLSLYWLISLAALLSLVRWSGSVPSLPENRVQRGESGLLVGCGEIQEDVPTQQDGRQSHQNLQGVHLHWCRETGTCLSDCLSLSQCLSYSSCDYLAPPLLSLQVNVDSSIREATNQSLHSGLGPASFQLAQDHIFSLMETDSYPRFLRSRLYAQLANHSTETVAVANEGGVLSVSE